MNIYSIVTVYVFLYIYYKSIRNETVKKTIFGLGLIYGLVSIANCFYHNFFNEMTDTPDVVMSLVIVIAAILYLFEILNSDKIVIINKVLLFWISIAILLYYIPIVPYQAVAKFYRNGHFTPAFYKINTYLGIIYYITFIVGFGIGCRSQQIVVGPQTNHAKPLGQT